ncbi:MAG TPA: hypothetical protein VEQ85_03640 [Lacipirellulaceae bacterium]|nr:hypothetical protein [Lacipirellulaceae bacterium]
MKQFFTWGGVIVGVAVVANTLLAWRVQSKHQSQLAAIRAAGHPASIDELKPAPLPAGENAAAQLELATSAIKAFGIEQHRFLQHTPLGKEYDLVDGDRLPSADQAAAMRVILAKHAPVGDAISRAAACDAWASLADFTLDHFQFMQAALDQVQVFRGMARYAAWDVAVLAAERKTDDAVRRGIELLKLARLHEAEPMMVNYLVTIAVRGVAVQALEGALRSGDITSATRAALDAELARAEDPQSFAAMLVGERAVSLEMMDVSPSQAPPWVVSWVGWPMKRHFIQSYELYDLIIAEAQGPWQTFRKFKSSAAMTNAQRQFGVLGDLLTPALAAGIDARDRDLVQIRTLRILSALQAFAAAQGAEASGLVDLSLPAEATTDPYSGAPLLLKHTDAGWTVYSVGENKQDDGGNFEKRLGIGIGPDPVRAAAGTTD